MGLGRRLTSRRRAASSCIEANSCSRIGDCDHIDAEGQSVHLDQSHMHTSKRIQNNVTRSARTHRLKPMLQSKFLSFLVLGQAFPNLQRNQCEA